MGPGRSISGAPLLPPFPSSFIIFPPFVYAGDWRAHVRELVFVYIWSVFVLIFCSWGDDFLAERDEVRLQGREGERESVAEKPVYVSTGVERREGRESRKGEEQYERGPGSVCREE